MARIDKIDPVGGSFRAKLAAAVVAADLGGVYGVAMNASGQVVRGGTVGQMVGVICPDKTMAVGDVIDVMKDGEIVEFDKGANDAAFASAAGTRYFAAASGAIGTTGTDQYIGHTVEATRLIVSVSR